MTDRDRRGLVLLLAIPVLLLTGLLIAGRTFFWGDLVYINHPWRELPVEFLQRGLLPLWDPYAYLGMPLAAQMQNGIWYPGSLPFSFFSFVTGLFLFHVLHFALGGLFCYLWLRKWKLARIAAFCGAAVFMGNGIMMSHVPFLNQLSCLSYLPAFLLFHRNGWLLGLSLALCFLSGYPTMLAGGALAAFLLVALTRAPSPSGRGQGEGKNLWNPWVTGGAFAVGATACLLLPALQLAFHSQRGIGLDLEQIFQFAFSPLDLMQFVSPLVVRSASFSPPIFWWKTAYLGFAAWGAIILAAMRIRPKYALSIGAYLAAVGLLILGDSNGVSQWLWVHASPLHYLRYPGNLAYLALPALALLVAAGVHRRIWTGGFAGILIAELGIYAICAQPTMPRNYFTDAGPLVNQLQKNLEDHRYLLSAGALLWHQGTGRDPESSILDLKHRLYGVSNIPYHLSGVGNFGEPLVPLDSYNFMDFMYRSGMDQAAKYLPWADTKILMTRIESSSNILNYAGHNLWHQYWWPGPVGRALWFDEETGLKIPENPGPNAPLSIISDGIILPFHQDRPDQFQVQGNTGSGWVYLAEPKVAGWELWLNGRPIESERALGAFQKWRSPTGAWELRGIYHPSTWRLGLLFTLLTLMGTAAYWYNQLPFSTTNKNH